MGAFICRAVILAGVLLCFSPGLARAQAPRPGRLIVTAVDPLGGLLPGATVNVAGLEDATRRVAVPPATTNERGVATIEAVVPGRYSVRVEFPGFDPGFLDDVRVRSGDNRQTVRLPLRRVNEVVTVAQDPQESAADRSMTFGSALTREQIDALSDDPLELQAQLRAMAGADAVISVDSFEGRQLPDKSQIRSIRISRDQFAAEIHAAGFPRIEVVTQPGNGPFRGSVSGNFYDSALDGSNPLARRTGPSQNKGLNTNISGTVFPGKLSVFGYVGGNSNYLTSTRCLASILGPVCGNAAVRSPSMFVNSGVGAEYALTKDRVLSMQFSSSRSRQSNQGLGDYNQIERAYETENRGYNLYVSEGGPVGRRFVLRSRLWFGSTVNESDSAVEAPTIIVLDQRTSGGAQRAGSTRTRSLSFGSDLDYVRGRHSFRAGTQVDGAWYRTDSRTNYLGTYTFESLETFEEGQPRSYTRSIGDPLVQYTNVQAALYIQDDIRIKRSLTITPGVRYEAQTHLRDYVNFAPRFGVTWAPFANGMTTLRASTGIFYDWLSTNTYQQTLQIDGFRQREINVSDPSFPDPGDAEAQPVNRYLIAGDSKMPMNTRLSLAIEQRFGPRLRLSQTYSQVRGSNLFVGRNLNAPVDGVRPDPTFANVFEAVSSGRSRQHTLETNVQLNMAGLNAGPAVPGAGALWEWSRGLALNGGYTYATSRNDTDGPFSTPATGALDAEWGPAPGDVRHRGNLSVGTQFLRNFTGRLSWNGSSAPPLNIRTGYDDNGDLVINDRPEGVGRNSDRVAGQWTTSAYFSYGFTLGTRRVATGGGVTVTGTAASGFTANVIGSQEVPRYRLNINVNIANLTNHANYTGYSGVLSSQFFRQPTAVTGVRRITFSANLSF